MTATDLSTGGLGHGRADDDQQVAGRVERPGRLGSRGPGSTKQPITRYLIRISVDCYPGDPERSNQLYRDHPLTWDEIDLHAWYGDNRAEPMCWTVQHNHDAFKKVWLLFAKNSGRFPLYPGESAWIEYTYTVSEDKWGHWFRRAVRLPTSMLSVTLNFPADLDSAVWGLHTSMTAESMPFQTAIYAR